jgi:hypothetical protein
LVGVIRRHRSLTMVGAIRRFCIVLACADGGGNLKRTYKLNRRYV